MTAKRRARGSNLDPNCGDERLLPIGGDAIQGGLAVLLNRWMWKRDRVVAHREFMELIATVSRAEHAHCECRRCYHLDIRHDEGFCSVPGCPCEEWL